MSSHSPYQMNSNTFTPKLGVVDIFKDFNLGDQPFDSPLENKCFIFYLLHLSNKYYDLDRLRCDHSYLQDVYNEYLNKLVEFCRPDFPPNIEEEEHVSFDKRELKDITKPVANSFMMYRRNYNKWLEKSGMKISNQQVISSLVSTLWQSESQEVRNYYKEISEKRKKLHRERLLQCVPDDDNETFINYKRQRTTE